MSENTFNPFEDRLSRDIRNTLSSALAGAIETGNDDVLDSVLTRYQARELPDYCRDYVRDRSLRYRKALSALQKGGDDPIIYRSLILWDLGLFFEVHEVLEHAWYAAKGDMKQTLQALIRAAGVYIKLEYGYIPEAEKIALKSLAVLRENRSILSLYFEPQRLISALSKLQPAPPKLLE